MCVEGDTFAQFCILQKTAVPKVETGSIIFFKFTMTHKYVGVLTNPRKRSETVLTMSSLNLLIQLSGWLIILPLYTSGRIVCFVKKKQQSAKKQLLLLLMTLLFYVSSSI